MMYNLKIEERAGNDLANLKKSEKTAYKKAVKLLVELQTHPTQAQASPND